MNSKRDLSNRVFQYLQYLGLVDIYDRLMYKRKEDIEQFQNNLKNIIADMHSNYITYQDLQDYDEANNLGIYEKVVAIPTVWKMKLAKMAGITPRNMKVIDIVKFVDIAMVVYITVANMILKELYLKYINNIHWFNNQLIFDYLKGNVGRKIPLMTEKDVIEMFEDELSLDIQDLIVDM